MLRNKKILVFIPARGGSKGIPDKNIYPVAGKPLIDWTLEQALALSEADAVVVSTNCPRIKAEALKYDGITVIDRPEEISQDTSKTIEAVTHTLRVLEKQGKFFDYLLLLQPTCPLRRTQDLKAALAHVVEENIPDLASVNEIPYHAFLMRHLEAGTGSCLRNKSLLNSHSTIRRQDAPKTYYVNGLFYIFDTRLLTDETSLNDARFSFVTDPACSIDINDPEDMALAAQELQRLSHA